MAIILTEKVFFQTSDNARIAALFLPSDSKRAVILVHQFNKDKSSYASLSKLLQQSGFGVLSIDLRGHGESRGKGSLSSPEALTPLDFQSMSKDLDASVAFLKQKGFSGFYLVGASIGANLAISFPAAHNGFCASVALSPGLDYKGLSPEVVARGTRVPLLLVASREDSYSFESATRLFSVVKAKKDFAMLSNAGHGTFMLSKSPDLKQKILDWLKSN